MQQFGAGDLVGVVIAEALGRALGPVLDYRAPAAGCGTGDFVAVPLGPRQVLGVVWGPGSGGFDPARLRTVIRVLDAPPMSAELRAFLARAADYTMTPLPLMLRMATRAPGLIDPPPDAVFTGWETAPPPAPPTPAPGCWRCWAVTAGRR